jgi:P4 family phage/plasmid primase-like protien
MTQPSIPVRFDCGGNTAREHLTPTELMTRWRRENFYEIAFESEDDLAVLFGDIDVSVKNSITEDEFNELNDAHRVALKNFIGSHQFALASGSSYEARKVSWRFYVPDMVGTASAQREWAEAVSRDNGIKLADGTPVRLDLSIYHKGRKMRMLHAKKQTKDADGNLETDTDKWENRPITIVEGSESDTILHRIKENAEVIKSSKSKKVIPLHHDDFDLWRKLVMECWSDDRANEFVSWRNGVWAIKSVENSDRGRELAHDFAKKSYKYSARDTDKMWEAGRDKITGASIHYWARSDNPIHYAELTAKLPIPFLEENIHEGDKGLANIFAKAFEGTLVSVKHTPKQTNYWAFKQKECLWAEVGTDYIITMFTEHMKTILTPLAVKIAKEYKDVADNEEGKVMKKKMESTLSLITQMTLTRTATKCMPQINTKIAVEKSWEDNLNNIKTILPVANGVLCLKTGELRPYELEDYLTYKLEVAYDKDADTSGVREFYKQIFNNDKDTMDFYQYWSGYSITGETEREEFIIMEGSDDGANAKSFEISCKNDVMGILMTTGDRKAFATKPDGCVNNDSLYNARFSRIVVIPELNKDSKLDEGIIKQFTGNDKVSVSAKYKNEISYTPQYKITMPLNLMFPVPAEAGALWRRIVIVQFKVRFISRDNPSWNEEDFKKGLIVERNEAKAKALRQDKAGWLKWLVEGAMEFYKNPGRAVPPTLQEHMLKVQQDNDPHLKFVRKEYVVTGKSDDYVPVAEMTASYPRPKEEAEGQTQRRLASTMKRVQVSQSTKAIYPKMTQRDWVDGEWVEKQVEDRSVKAKTTRVWVGIRRKTEEEKEAEE